MSKVPSTAPFSLPGGLAAPCATLIWEGLGVADVPFGDDLNITAMPDMAGRLMLD